MKISTNQPILNNPKMILSQTATFWEHTTEVWREIWGEHIHHGYYDAHEKNTSLTPQELLLEKIIGLIQLSPGQKLLDVGCGMGGTSLYLAKHYPIQIDAINISDSQLDYAKKQSQRNGVSNVRFHNEDAHALKIFPDNSFDIVWSLESCEQFSNKELFIQQAYRVLKPGGKLMLATWCSDKEQYENKQADDYLNLCKTFSVPYMPTISYYTQLLEKNFTLLLAQDWSNNVKESWNIGMNKLKTYSYFKLFKIAGFRGLPLIRKVNLISDAFLNGKIRYGVFIAHR